MTFRGLDHLDGFVPGDLICASGIVQDVRHGTIFGTNTDVDGKEDITSMGGDYLGQPLNGLSHLGVEENFQVSSDNANDDSSGTGAQAVRITYLDDAGDWREATVDLDGTTDVDFGVSGIRCFIAEATRFGSSGTNAGTITITHDVTTSRVFAQIRPGVGKSEVAAFTIPAGHICVIKDALINLELSSTVRTSAAIRTRGEGQGGYVRHNIIRHRSDESSFHDPAYICVPGLTDVKFTAETVNKANTTMSGQFNYLIFKQ